MVALMIIAALLVGMTAGGAIAVIVQHRYHLRLERELMSRVLEKAGVRPLDTPAAPVPEPKKPGVQDRLRFKV